MFNADTFAKMKDGAVLINNSRGELVDNAAVVAAVESGKLERYITDFPADQLIGVKNIICVPPPRRVHARSGGQLRDDGGEKNSRNTSKNGNIVHSVNYPRRFSRPRSSVSPYDRHARQRKGVFPRSLPSSLRRASISPTFWINPKATRRISSSTSTKSLPIK